MSARVVWPLACHTCFCWKLFNLFCCTCFYRKLFNPSSSATSLVSTFVKMFICNSACIQCNFAISNFSFDPILWNKNLCPGRSQCTVLLNFSQCEGISVLMILLAITCIKVTGPLCDRYSSFLMSNTCLFPCCCRFERMMIQMYRWVTGRGVVNEVYLYHNFIVFNFIP